MSVCILISTCEKYRPLAEFTRARIVESWPEAPPIRVSGLLDGDGAVPRRDNERDWMKVIRSACEDLIAEGFTSAYLILDDHPPLGTCHAKHLNETLPVMMRELGAVSIALSGYGQGRVTNGKIVNWRDWALDLCTPKAQWRYPLHPALWRLDALRDVLSRLIEWLPESEHTPWAFERKGGLPDANLPAELTCHCYRIEGASKAARKASWKIDALRSATDIYRFAVRKIAGDVAKATVDERILGLHHYYHGPYPLIWSGVMREGRINSNALFLFAMTGRKDWIARLQDLRFE